MPGKRVWLLVVVLACVCAAGCAAKDGGAGTPGFVAPASAPSSPAPTPPSGVHADASSLGEEALRPGTHTFAAHPAPVTGSLPTLAPRGSAVAAGGIDNTLDDYDSPKAAGIADPLEPWNRFWFHFNDFVYRRIARPLYRGYDAIMPDDFQSGLSNFLRNMLFPVRFVNNILQGKFKAAGVEYGRFVVNTTAGFGGFFNITKDRKTIVPLDESGEDFGQTLGHWGVGYGFYLVLPFVGPSSLRDALGLGVDGFLNPSCYLQPAVAAYGVNAGLRFNSLRDILPTYEGLDDISVDPYIGMREAYHQYRRQHISQ